MSENPPNPPGRPEDPYSERPAQPPQPSTPPPSEHAGGATGYQGGQQPFYSAAASSAAGVARDDTKGLLGSLFDFSFSNYVTPKIVKIVYVILTVLIAIGWLFSFIAGVVTLFSDQWYVGLVTILFGWIAALVYLAVWRIGLEVFQAVVNISEKMNHYARRDGMV
ncbi:MULTISPECIES: DUF4282 domain-containing protein [Isoptericola]|uniref:DUF4282 domain-containing protein n=1 Tax=Isoptericola sediminis TaxID=2733572 RepID=A0A849K8P5_9MICO|nr:MULTISPECIES: DUF4282 domain-containing protein [Isoptericola]MDO8145352.1 DUF4282 domain-containing protein [Isoptericola sp. 178]MDO8148993.1 DUF4282 domain-containing protein [Isoptericola sp. b515]MDO8151067.1 DUF4282 domain-containing protein [Isoptericola sp. b408]NNU28399.1 DUF4282 domain-containing protein [Isoptericola sediminis]